MSRGRCSGCGFENVSCKVVKTHVRTCPDYVALFKENPDAALDPEEEYRKHREAHDSEEGEAARDERQQDRAAEFRSNAEAILQRQRERWDSHAVPLLTEERDSV
jgi:hypothetical protein